MRFFQQHVVHGMLLAASLGMLIPAASFSDATLPAGYIQEKDGFTVYIGLMPAELLEGVEAQTMHGGIPAEGTHRIHLTVAVFETSTGTRVKDAIVKARMTSSGQDTGMKLLETMLWKDKLVYGSYFSLFDAGPYTIRVQFRTSRQESPVEVIFKYNAAHV